MTPIPFKRHRFRRQIIRYAIWFCARFTLSFRDGGGLPAVRGIEVSNQALRRCFLTFRDPIAAILFRCVQRHGPTRLLRHNPGAPAWKAVSEQD
jgi:transposase-like protein